MGTISRGVKNSFRNGVRSISIILILSISICMALVMLISLKTVQSKIDSVKGSIGNFITVSPAGIRGFEGGGELLTNADADTITKINGVTKVVKTLSDRLRTVTDTNLQPAQDAGNFGQRQRRFSENNTTDSNRPADIGNFQMPIMVNSTNDLTTLSGLNMSKLDFTSGAVFDANTSNNVAIVGTDLATKNNLSVGGTFTAHSKDITVVGIFDGGNQFANTSIIFPLLTLQTLSSQTDQINSITVQVSSIDKLTEVESILKSTLGDKADVTSNQDTSNQAIAPLENIRTISLYSLISSVIAGGIILFLSMIMIVRERRREIGVLKAIGSSNIGITIQFAVESLVLTLLSSIVGIITGTLLSNPILKVLIANNTTTQSPSAQNFGRGGGMALARLGAGAFNGAENAVRDLTATVGVEIILYGIIAAIIIAIIGSAIPSIIISKISPAEVMRTE